MGAAIMNTTGSSSAHSPFNPQDMTPTGRVIQWYVLPVICCLGIVGILITLVVLSRKSMRTSTNCYLTALASTDLIFLLLLATHLGENQFTPLSKMYYQFEIYVTYSAIVMQVLLLASVWITVMLAIERYIGICKPFVATDLCTIKKARGVIVGIYVVAVFCRAPNFWETHVRTVNDSADTSITFIEGSALSIDSDYITWYPWMVDGLLTSMLPFVTLLLLNCRLIWEVKKSTKYLQQNQMLAQSSTSIAIQREDLQVTVMLISVIIVFFICQAPYVIYTAIMSINKFVLYSRHIMVFRRITILMLTLKSSLNFILYCWFSEKFLTSLKTIFDTSRRRSSSRSASSIIVTKRLSVPGGRGVSAVSGGGGGAERYVISMRETFV